jgi:hypothetical protein
MDKGWVRNDFNQGLEEVEALVHQVNAVWQLRVLHITGSSKVWGLRFYIQSSYPYYGSICSLRA